jgi:hypothetical protein
MHSKSISKYKLVLNSVKNFNTSNITKIMKFNFSKHVSFERSNRDDEYQFDGEFSSEKEYEYFVCDAFTLELMYKCKIIFIALKMIALTKFRFFNRKK